MHLTPSPHAPQAEAAAGLQKKLHLADVAVAEKAAHGQQHQQGKLRGAVAKSQLRSRALGDDSSDSDESDDVEMVEMEEEEVRAALGLPAIRMAHLAAVGIAARRGC